MSDDDFSRHAEETPQPDQPPAVSYGPPPYDYPAERFGPSDPPDYAAPAIPPYQTSQFDPPSYAPPPAYQPQSYPNSTYGQAPTPGAPGVDSAPRLGRSRTVLVAAAVAAVVGAGVGAGVVAAFDHHDGNTTASGVSVTTQTAPNTAKLDGTVTAAAAKITPSVVTINVTGQSEAGTGSGVILRNDGYILTNNHVVAVAASSGKIQVLTHDGQTAAARVVGTDQSDDLAVIKVDGLSKLTAATFAKSSALQVGQTVVAVGAPLGLSDTVTSGIVSDTARPVETGDGSRGTTTAVFNAIQTDAAINPGNSGGPLVDLNGNVVGIDAAIASAGSGGVTVPGQSTQSGSIGIGFAIPSDEASRIAAELIATGKATHAVIGVSVTSSQTATGATIGSVTANSPGAKAGLKAGDVVTKFNDQLITANIDLVAATRSYAPGTTISLTFTRGGASQTVKITLGTAGS